MIQHFEGFLSDLINSPYPKTQMDVLCKGMIVLQVFNQADAMNWGFELPMHPKGGLLINLFFHKGKSKMHERFKDLPYSREFTLVKLDKDRVDSYYLAISSEVKLMEVALRLDQIVKDMCENEIDINSIEVYVRAFR